MSESDRKPGQDRQGDCRVNFAGIENGKGGHEPPFSLKGLVPSGKGAPLMKPTTTPPKTYRVKSFGCQMNVYDGERMAKVPRGYDLT